MTAPTAGPGRPVAGAACVGARRSHHHQRPAVRGRQGALSRLLPDQVPEDPTCGAARVGMPPGPSSRCGRPGPPRNATLHTATEGAGAASQRRSWTG